MWKQIEMKLLKIATMYCTWIFSLLFSYIFTMYFISIIIIAIELDKLFSHFKFHWTNNSSINLITSASTLSTCRQSRSLHCVTKSMPQIWHRNFCGRVRISSIVYECSKNTVVLSLFVALNELKYKVWNLSQKSSYISKPQFQTMFSKSFKNVSFGVELVVEKLNRLCV